MKQFTGNAPGTGGLVTFPRSNWLMSVVLAYQPHFLGQPSDVDVFWGYGLFPDQPGDHVGKKMSECGGAEILTELCLHLRFEEHLPRILETSDCIPCRMPYITRSIYAARAGRSPPGQAGRDDEPRLHRAVLRNARRCGLHGGIFHSLGSNGRLLDARNRSGSLASLSRTARSRRLAERGWGPFQVIPSWRKRTMQTTVGNSVGGRFSYLPRGEQGSGRDVPSFRHAAGGGDGP